ncbi:putative lipoprotein [Clostridium sporogenes]|uniref:hypothetical protein n=1 Tax=Clostridium botulinum TaxID=1491 RepID=UPI0007178F26|nr:hypothetical protein [Clostridium botulinum]KRU25151.1 putative lipoprotein [Clostridium sporogenes]KRU28028.1 putative lipoprotein [Clostridium sporogenes]KRU28734.1 putative lipoprotein [Clostridium sporogenes]KRU44223.1 putative lipoprotein [Clostridium sporogenes]MBZ1329926.1 hypothetical protein [Clostridium botulinum]
MKKKKFFKMVLLCLSFIFCLGLFVGCESAGEAASRQYEERKAEAKNPENKKKNIYYGVQEEVKNKLKAPSTAKFPIYDESFVEQIDDTHYKVDCYVDAENGFGAKIRSNYSCDIEYDDKDSDYYTITNLTIDQN